MNETEESEKSEEPEIDDISGTVDEPAEDAAPAAESNEETPPPPEKIRARRKPIQFPFLLVIIILLGLAIRIALLITENKVYVDGVHYLLQGENIRSHIWDTWDPNGGRWSIPPLYPVFVAFFLSFTSDLMRSGQIASMLLALTIIPAMYLIARSFLGEKGGLWAAFITALDPLTAHYSIVTYAEPTFMAMTAWCIWFSVLSIEKKEKIIPPIFMGIFAALAYLAKAFGLVLAAWGFVLLFYYALTSRTTRISIGLRNVLLYTIAFLIIAVPYWFFLLSYVGHFAPDGKSQFEFTRLHAPNIKLESIDPRYEGIITDYYEYAIYSGEPEFGHLEGMEFARNYIHKYFQKLNEVFVQYPVRLVPPFKNVRLTSTLFLILFGLGLLAVPLTLSRSATPRVLLAWFPLWLFIAPLGFIEVRYFVPFTLLIIPFVASGMYHLEDWLRNTSIFSPNSFRRLIIPFMVVIFLLNCYPSYSYRLTHLGDVESNYWEYKYAGEFMRKYTNGKGGNLLESADMTSYYAGMQGWVIPQTDYNGLIHFMLKHDIKYFAMDEYLTTKKHQRPDLKSLFRFPPEETDELKPIYSDDEYTGHRLVIYELKDEIIELWKQGRIE